MLRLDQSKENVTITQVGRHIEVKTPVVEMSCDLPLGCQVQGHDCHVRFQRLPVECTISAHDLIRDTFIGIHTMPSEQTRRFLYQYDEIRWLVRLGKTSVKLYASEVLDTCTCLDIINQRYAQALRDATNLLETWKYHQAKTRGKVGVQLLLIHMSTWKLLQRFAREFQATEGESIWHCFGDSHHGEALTLSCADGTVHATLWAMPHESYRSEEYLPLLYEYPDGLLLAHEEETSLPWQILRLNDVWTAAQTDQWLSKTLIPHVLSHYKVYQDALSEQTYGLRYWLAQTLAPEVFTAYHQEHGVARPTLRKSQPQERVPLDDVCDPSDLIPYIDDLHVWFATYPVARIPSLMLRQYYEVIAEYVEHASPTLFSISALSTLIEEMGQTRESKPKANGWSLLSSSFEAFSSSLAQQVRRVQEVEYEYVTCADLLSQTFIHALEHKPYQASDELVKKTTEVVQLLWEQARFDERYCITLS